MANPPTSCRPQALSAFMDGELAPLQAEEIRAHLTTCLPCGAALEELLLLDGFAATAHRRRSRPRSAAGARPFALLLGLLLSFALCLTWALWSCHG